MLQGLAEDALEGGVVALFLENGQSAIGAIEDMINIAAQSDAIRSSHAQNLTG